MSKHYEVEPKFVLSDCYEILDTQRSAGYRKKLSKIEDENVTKVLNNEMFILYNRQRDTPLLITPVIKQFLEEFRAPIEVPEVTHKFADEIGVHPKKIAPRIVKFLNDMLYRGILIPEEDADKVRDEIAAENIGAVGKMLDNYRITKELVIKSKVELWLAEDTQHDNRPCVLKVLALPVHIKNKKRKSKLRSFRQEFDLLDELQGHPAVCSLYEFVKDDRAPFAVMEYINGVSLRRWLKHNQLFVADKIKLIRQAFSVMAHVHDRKILHGDLHSSNFMIEADGTLRLIDFDLSNHKKLRKAEIHREGGVHEYMPPERIKDSAFGLSDGRADYRSEVFQIGVIAYFILYGKLPFKAFSWKQLAAKIRTEHPEFPAVTADGEIIPDFIIDIIKKAMAKCRKERYKNAKKLYKALLSTL